MRIVLALISLAGCGSDARDTPSDAVLPDAQHDALLDSAPKADTARMFAHSGNTLYALDRETLAATEIGAITGIGAQAMLDLAVDKDDHFIGITRDTLYSIHPGTGGATRIADLASSARGLTSLSYAPSDFRDPASDDMLVAASDQGAVYRIDMNAETGALATQIGSFGASKDGEPIGVSGDLIAIRGFGVFATVNLVGGEVYEDHLARIDPATWKATLIGPTGFDNIFGLGFWSGKLYGFVDNGTTGSLIELDPETGRGTLIATSNVRWLGAGVATDAPI